MRIIWNYTDDVHDETGTQGAKPHFSMYSDKALVYESPHVWIPVEDVWVPKGQTVTVAGRNIAGMIYLGRRDGDDFTFEPCADSVIDPSLEAAENVFFDPSRKEEHFNYLRYHLFCTEERGEYLAWLTSDRSDTDCDEAYIRLYFYGLERRFFVDSPSSEEGRAIIAEVERLLKAYGDGYDFAQAKREMSEFLYTAYAVIQPPEEIQPRYEVIGKKKPTDIRVAIGYRMNTGRPLNADWSLSWYITHRGGKLRVAALRVFPEFRALFGQLFEKKFPEGLSPLPSWTPLTPRYKAASKAFYVDLSDQFKHLDDIAEADPPPAEIGEMIQEATKALNKYSRFLGEFTIGKETIEAHTLLPGSLWPLFPNTAVDELQNWAEKIIESGGFTPIEQVVSKVDEEERESISKRHIIKAAATLALMSIGMVPDPRFELRGPKQKESVMLFRLPEPVTELQEISSKYSEALLGVLIGGFIAHADHRITKEENAALDAYIHSAPVTESERNRLLANLQWILAVPPTLAEFRRHLKKASPDALRKIGKFALCMAAMDGTIASVEVEALQKLYKAMGLQAENVYSDLHALSTLDGSKIILSAATKEQDLAIPCPDCSRPVVLDEQQIALLKTETAQVSALLGDIFEEEITKDATTDSNDSNDTFDGLDAIHSAFLRELLTRQHWGRSEYAALAERFQLMQEGALETLNEWSFERFEDILIDEDSDYRLNPEISMNLGP